MNVSPLLPAARIEMSASPSQRLRHAGEQFESMLLTDVFAKLRQSFSLESDHQDAGHDTLTAMADEALCNSIAERGGLGLAAMISKSVARKNV